MIIILIITPIAFAKPRKTYLVDFLLKNKIDNEGFAGSLKETTYALEIIDYYDLIIKQQWYGINETNVNASITRKYLEDYTISSLNNKTGSIYDLYYFYKSSNILGGTNAPGLIERIKDYLSKSRVSGGGFAPYNTSKSASLSSTYYAINLYSLLNETIPTITSHKNFVLSCRNSDGGFGGNASLSSTITDTFYALQILHEISNLSYLTRPDITLKYLNSTYCNDESDTINYGGYLPDENSKYASLSTTYYCVQAISLINSSKLSLTKQFTINWLLSRQNFQDGGFVDIGDQTSQIFSSISGSYYAFEALKTLNADLNQLEEEVFMVEWNYWILIILLSSIGIAIAIYIFVQRSRKI